MTPSKQDLLERAEELLEILDEVASVQPLQDHELLLQRFLEDVREELEGA